ncbi:hypothetical protein [Pacificoceanicola onchidii]|uniref:hypothetical protein n=1 Tax=Pacificoceanicola onchidii TaxID=2562685 RepID=UPI0010A63E56|nr:hypothetical protein [Pacificoceanicola onchidii]
MSFLRPDHALPSTMDAIGHSRHRPVLTYNKGKPRGATGRTSVLKRRFNIALAISKNLSLISAGRLASEPNPQKRLNNAAARFTKMRNAHCFQALSETDYLPKMTDRLNKFNPAQQPNTSAPQSDSS